MRGALFSAARNPRRSVALAAQQGFNLIEIMIAVAIIGVFLGIGIPAIGDWVQNRQVGVLAESIASGLRLAQAEAVQRNVQIDMVFTTSDVTSPSDPSAATLAQKLGFNVPGL